MAEHSDLPLSVRAFLKTFRWRRIDPVPWTRLAKPLTAARVAIVTTAGLVAHEQASFDASIRGGDASFRLVDDDVELHTLRDTHRSRSFDHTAMQRDPNLVFPRDRMHELVAAGAIGAVNRRHLSFMGSITRTSPLIEESAPAAAALLAEDGVDAVLLVPV